MIKLNFLFLSFFFLSCKNSNDFKRDFEAHKFDEKVIQNLPQYDTLRQIILASLDSFKLSNSQNDFTYIYNFDTSTETSGNSNTALPKIIYPQTVQFFERVGRDNLFGFIVSKDSTVGFLIRNTHLTKYFLDVRDRLYWYPSTRKIPKTEFPIKDTMLGERWQYQIWYDKRAEF
jgi:hypothetical protein